MTTPTRIRRYGLCGALILPRGTLILSCGAFILSRGTFILPRGAFILSCGAFREGAFSCGDLLRHLGAIERFMFAENAALRPSCYPGHGPELAAGYDEVFAYLDRMHAEAKEIFAALTPEDLERKCATPGGAGMAVWKWLRAMVEHEVHHRGQIYMILSLLGIPTPPLYGLTSEEVRARSAE